ncbi:MAG: PLP-dependent transferase [Candidatus Thermoplasmatota archaeon]|jgi:cystathionine beta-lyase/cystathionine gamma-synthase|nr:PLP-dependent transferase [Candidatus Thermoplasmatota archaeon]MCL5667906.1 PLP-dependent transferase [Candidatus Thermoplasmatota archaeon]
MVRSDNFNGFNTKAVQSGELKDQRFGNITTPIFETSTFVFPNYDKEAYIDHTRNEPYIYSRWGNPTTQSLELKYAALEGSEEGLAFSSGMAAISTAVIAILGKGGKLLSVGELYGQTQMLFAQTLKNYGFSVDFISIRDFNAGKFDCSGYSAVYTESITNPTLMVADIRNASRICGEFDIPLLVDATFASPFNQKPITLGASVAIHSATKYISGHSDVILGLVGSGAQLFPGISSLRKSLGGTPDPLQSFLALRGLKTLGLRMAKHNTNGMELAKFLKQHKKIRKVFYPGIEESEFFDVARSNLSGYGGMISFEIAGGIEKTRKFIANLTIASAAPSLGGVESLITLPVDTSHSKISREERLKMGIEDSLVRFSCGIEDIEDIVADFENALAQI